MMISISNVRSCIAGELIVNDLLNRLVIGDISVYLKEEKVEEFDVDLISLYFSLKDAFLQSFCRELECPVRVDFETKFKIVPVQAGCCVYPAQGGESCAPVEMGTFVSIHAVRQIMKSIEGLIREYILPYRAAIINILDSSDSFIAFDLVRLIDADVEVVSSKR